MSTPLSPGPERARSGRSTIFLVLAFSAFAEASGEPLTLVEDRGEYPLGLHAAVLEDPQGMWSIEEVADSDLSVLFTENDRKRVSVGLADHPVWLKVDLQNKSRQTAWIVEFPTVGWQSIEIYKPSKQDGSWEVTTTPEDISFNQRPIRYRFLAVPLTLGIDESCRVFIRFVPPVVRPNSFPITLWQLQAFDRMTRADYFVQALYFGLASVMVLYNLFLFLSLRDRAYLYYVLMAAALTAWFGFTTGIAREFLWPGGTWDHLTVRFVLVGLVWFLTIRFTQVYLLTHKHTPGIHNLLWGAAVYHLGCGLAAALGLPVPGVVNSLAVLATIALQFTAPVISIRKGYRPAWFFLVANGCLIVVVAIGSLARLDLIPYFLATSTPLQPASALEMVLFSLGLADRINVLRIEREKQELAVLEAERKGREAREQSERKSAFLASMAHELRTPMNAIKGFSNIVARREKALSDRGKENLHKVDRASDHLLAMINDLLDLSKIEAGRMDVTVSTFSVRQTILSACDVVSPLVQEGVELRHDIADDIGEAHTDQQRISQMLINLLSNAIKFTDQGSVLVEARITPVTLSRDEQSSARIEGPANGGNSGSSILISVSDTGKGIPESELPTLFDEYRQVDGQSESTVQRGTGLGLSITKRFAELLGGSITVESELGTGSTFTVTIPREYSELGANA